jgi:hypothetical protein
VTLAQGVRRTTASNLRLVALKGFERRLEKMVEGAFGRVFRSGLRPVELGRRLVREMDDGRSVDVRGRTLVPNHFTVELSTEDHTRFAEVHSTLIRELAETAREHARDEGYVFMGPIGVELVESSSIRAGAFQITGRMREGRGGSGAGSLLLSTGDRIPLGEDVVTIGRRPESTIVLADPNVSRNHAEIRPHGTTWVVVDLGSTNGSRVNGVRVSSQDLHDGDDLSFGSTHAKFEAC